MSENKTYNITYLPELLNPYKMTNWTFSWDQLAQILTHPRPFRPKKSQSLWSPAIFDGKRAKSNVVEVSLLVFDIDEGIEFSRVKSTLDYFDLTHIMHTTSSHTQQHNKFRVVLPLEKPIKAPQWPAVYLAALDWFEDLYECRPDAACKDPSRAFYLPYQTEEFKTSVILDGKTMNFERMGKRKQKEIDAETQRRNEERKARASKQRRSVVHSKRHNKRWSLVDWDNEIKAQLNTSKEARLELAHKIGALVVTVQTEDGKSVLMAKGFSCPYCTRTDATYYSIDPNVFGLSSGFCNHRNSCGDGTHAHPFTLYWLARHNGLV